MKKEVKNFMLGAVAVIAAQKAYKALGLGKYVKPLADSVKAKILAKLDKLAQGGSKEEPKAE